MSIVMDTSGYTEPVMRVWCRVCKGWVEVSEVEIENVEEDAYGRDRVTFKHKVCGVVSRSLVAAV